MRTVLFLATLTLAAAAAPAQQPAPTPARPGAGEQKPPAGEEAPPPEQKVGEAPTVPTGQTASEAAAAVPDTGVIAKVNVQGNRRVESDAIRAAIPLKAGDTFDRDKLKALLDQVSEGGYEKWDALRSGKLPDGEKKSGPQIADDMQNLSDQVQSVVENNFEEFNTNVREVYGLSSMKKETLSGLAD